MYADVIVEYSAKALDQCFTYKIPDNLKSNLKIGMKVKIPFGKLILNGFVLGIKNESDKDNLKEIIKIVDDNFVLNDELINLGKYIKESTLCSLITAYQAMLPSSLKVKNIKSNYQKYNEYLEIDNEEKAISYIKDNLRRKKQIELVNRLLNKEIVFKGEYSSLIVNALLDINIIKIRKEIKYRINVNDKKEKSLKLTNEQENAVTQIYNSFNKNDIFLLYGVTGSGKTEVYLNLIDKVIKNNKTVIMLVPEISLSTQIVDRFYKRFGSNVAIFHSSLSEGERYDEYQKVLNGDAHIVVGTRSAIFMPLKNIGLIIMDEEQSLNYKQDNNPRYHARNIAIERCKYHNCPLVLGSATPSLESYARALKGVYKLLTLNKRIGSSMIPESVIVDMEKEYKKRNMIISDLLDEKIKDRLEKNEQVILFLNRRGFNTIMSCKNCGYTFKCKYCDITLTYHKSSNNLRCHYCGYTLLNSKLCPSCNEDALTSYGLGTEKVEEELIRRYPNANIIRYDADTTTKKGSNEKIIKEIEEGNADIIIGTQMISKGFDFPKVTLVGIINADDSLNIPDFRSGEKTFELLNQTIGRAGRSKLKGEAIIQTFNPDNKTLSYVLNNDYKGLFNYEMNIRKMLKYPPYFYLTLIKINSKDYEEASTEANKVLKYLNNSLKDVIILGPTTANVFKVNNIYRFQIILKYKNYSQIKNTLINLTLIYKINNKVNIEIDNDPSRI